MTLNELPVGAAAVITSVGGEGSLRQHFLDMGIIPGAKVEVVKFAPMGDPMQLRIHGYELTLRLADAERIVVREIEKSDEVDDCVIAISDAEHPGFGESGYRFHDPSTEHPLPKEQQLMFALVGNQNCGKTTLFNQLTGSNQHVGNFPGVTVDRKESLIKGSLCNGATDLIAVDLPGAYSMSPYTS